MPKIDWNLLGSEFEKLTVVEPQREVSSDDEYDRHTQWVCECKCGKLSWVTASSLRGGQTRSCGCIRKGTRQRKEAAE